MRVRGILVLATEKATLVSRVSIIIKLMEVEKGEVFDVKRKEDA